MRFRRNAVTLYFVSRPKRPVWCVRFMILLIDNYDSFTYNLAQFLGQLGEKLEVRRNDQITLDQIAAKKPERIVISPGPARRRRRHLRRRHSPIRRQIPILGVCLGHQAIGYAFGGR